MNPFFSILGALCFLYGSIAPAADAPAKQAGSKPNIIVVLADDLGYADVGYHGFPAGKEVFTTNIDRLVGSGTVFRQAYLTMLMNADEGVGKVLATLESEGLRQKTLVYFLSDNGAALARPNDLDGVNLPLRSGKGSCFEGGVRVPYMMSWPGTIAAGRTSNLLVSSRDIFSTAIGLDVLRFEAKSAFDTNNDSSPDGGCIDGVNRWRLGVNAMLANLRRQLGGEAIITADSHNPTSQRSVGLLNGMESEGLVTHNDAC